MYCRALILKLCYLLHIYRIHYLNLERPTFKNQMGVKFKLSFAKWANQLWSCSLVSQVRLRVKASVNFCY